MIRAGAMLALLAACQPQQVAQPPAHEPAPTAPRVIVFVRHAEKQSDDGDAPLSAAGHARAECLAQTLGDAAITHAFTTELQRTKDTLAPLLAAHSITPTVISTDATSQLVDTLRALPPAAIAVVAGHANTIPDVLAELGAERIAFDKSDYDWLFVLALPSAGPPTLVRARYCVIDRSDTP
jgi:broad specificity phosphatase PhoE